MSGKYEDDFESKPTGNAVDAATINLSNEQAISASEATRTNAARTSVKEMNCRGNEPAEEGEAGCQTSEDEDDTLTISFNDIGTLRRSLERDEIIRESLADSLTVSVSPHVSYYALH